jgi:hypothetical protein
MVTDAMNRQTKETNGHPAAPLTAMDDAITGCFRADAAAQTPVPSAERRTKTALALRLIGIAALTICAGCPDCHDMASHRNQPSTMLRFSPAAKRADVQDDADRESGP